jgi:hypothetical protein
MRLELLSVNNSKLKKSGDKHGLRFASFGIPAAATCSGADACKAGCYALSGSYLWAPVVAARKRNFEATRDSGQFVSKMAGEIAALDSKCRDKVLAIRIHDSGDFYSRAYLESWLAIIDQFPHVIFYAYTKSVHLFDAEMLQRLPDNFRVVFSLGGKFDHMVKRDKMSHARVFESVEALIAAGYVDASEDDAVAIFGGRNIGLVYHGAKNIQNTNWSKVG